MREARIRDGFELGLISRRDFLWRAGVAGLAFGAAGTLGSLATACGGQQNNGPAPKGTKVSGSLTLAYFGTAVQQKTWNDLFKLFKKEYHDVQLQAHGIPASDWGSFFDTVNTQIAGGKVPDVVQVATEGQRLFASRGLVQPIDAYIKRDRGYIDGYLKAINPNLIKWNKKYSSPDKNTYYLPGEFNTMCMWCNLKLFNKAGLAKPTNNWTWNDFLGMVEKIKKRTGAYGFYVQAEDFAGIMPWLLTNGASTLNSQWTKATVDTPKAVEAFKFMRLLVAKGLSPKPGGTFDMYSAMAKGKLAMFGGGRWPVINMRDLHFVREIQIVAWPHKERQGTPVGWNAYPIMKQSQNKEAAWAFVKFIASKKASEYFARKGGTIVPPRKSVALSQAFLSDSPQGSAELYKSLDYATPIPSPNQGSVFEKDIINTTTEILAGSENPEKALKQLNGKMQSALQ